MKSDTLLKRCQFIQKNCEIIQEFGYCHPKTISYINSVYNSHMTGSPLWNLFSKSVDMLYKSWNVSVRNMFGLNMKTHRYIIEPLSGTHLQSILIKRFLNFISKIRASKKSILNHILKHIEEDCRSTTGLNLRNILLLSDINRVHSLSPMVAQNIFYHQIEERDLWRIGAINEIIDAMHGGSELPEFDKNELQEMLDFICIS